MKEIPSEIIIVDSNSTDGTKELVKSYPVKFVSINEKSMTRARNIGFQLAKGDVVAYLDDDTITSENWAKKIIEPYV